MKRLVAVYWLDASFDLEDTSATLVSVVTYGVLLQQDNDLVVVASEFFKDDGDYRGITAIPACTVTRIVDLTEGF